MSDETIKSGQRVEWYRGDTHLKGKQRHGTVTVAEDDRGLATVAWDDGSVSEVFANYLETSEVHPRERRA